MPKNKVFRSPHNSLTDVLSLILFVDEKQFTSIRKRLTTAGSFVSCASQSAIGRVCRISAKAKLPITVWRKSGCLLALYSDLGIGRSLSNRLVSYDTANAGVV